METVSNPNPIPLAEFQVGQIYQHGPLTCLPELVRITAIGRPSPYPDGSCALPNCLSYKYVGWRKLDGRWYEEGWLRADDDDREDYRTPSSDRIYFFRWDGLGVLFGTPKAALMEAELAKWRELRARYNGRDRSPAMDKLYQRMEAQEQVIQTFFETVASDDPQLQPPPPPPKRTRAKLTSAWAEL